MRLKIRHGIYIDHFAARIQETTGFTTDYNLLTRIVSVNCLADTEEETLELLRGKIGLKKRDYTLLPD